MIFKENNSIYLQIGERVCEEILKGRYPEGGRIPSVRDYAVMVEVNVNTMVKVYEHLERQGVIHAKRGLGYFVSEGAVDLLRENKRNTFLAELWPEVLRQAKLLGISRQELMAAFDKVDAIEL